MRTIATQVFTFLNEFLSITHCSSLFIFGHRTGLAPAPLIAHERIAIQPTEEQIRISQLAQNGLSELQVKGMPVDPMADRDTERNYTGVSHDVCV